MKKALLKSIATTVCLFALAAVQISHAAQSVIIGGWEAGLSPTYEHADFSVADLTGTEGLGERNNRGSNDGTWGDDTNSLSLTEGGAVQDPTTATGSPSSLYCNNNNITTFLITNNSSSKYTIAKLYFDWQANNNGGQLELWVDGVKHESVSSSSPTGSGQYNDYADASLAFQGSVTVNSGDSLTFTLVNNGGYAMDMDNIAIVGSVYAIPTYLGTPVILGGWSEDGLTATYKHSDFIVSSITGGASARNNRGSNDGLWGDDTGTGTLVLSEGGAIQNPTTDCGAGFTSTSIFNNNQTNVFSFVNVSAHEYRMQKLYFDWQANSNNGYLELWVGTALHSSNTTSSAQASGGDNESRDYTDGSVAFLAETVVAPGATFTFNFVNNGGFSMDMDNIAVVGSIIIPSAKGTVIVIY